MQLQLLLSDVPGAPIDVLNAGTPGYTTAANIIQLALRDHYINPELVIVYQGLNDLRNSHSPNFSTDEANSHACHQAAAMDVDWVRGHGLSALRFYVRHALAALSGPKAIEEGERRSEPDPRVARVYRSNLRSLVALARTHGSRVVFVPQVLRSVRMECAKTWLPYVDTDSLLSQLDALHAVMRSVASEEGVPFVAEVLTAPWEDGDFIDYCHLSASGCSRLASILDGFLRKEGLLHVD